MRGKCGEKTRRGRRRERDNDGDDAEGGRQGEEMRGRKNRGWNIKEREERKTKRRDT